MRRVLRRTAVLATVLLALAGATTASASRTTGLEGVPRFSHVVVLVLENKNFTDTWGPDSPAHYLKSLRSEGTLADHYYATGHASLDNYIAMVSGQPDNPVTGSDCLTVSLWTCAQVQLGMANGRNLGDQFDEAGVSWKGYMDSMPSACFHGPYDPVSAEPDPYQGHSQEPPATDYADRHNPFIYFPDIVGDDARCKQHDVPYSQLAGDLARNRLPQFAFVTPDTCHDGHDDTCSDGQPGGLVAADLWLSQQVPALLDYLRHHNGLLLITFDENESPVDGELPGCCTGGPGGTAGFGGRIGLLALGTGIPGGRVVPTAYDHMSLLRTIEDSFSISEHLNNASTASPMVDVLTGR
jgi:phospholipase C